MLRIKALHELKMSKASGIDDILVELLTNNGKDIKCKLFEVIEKMYRDGNIPDDYQKQNCTNL